ncbi:transposase [Ulvibacterium marinum]|uniref:Transposase n=2 Tax=Ulvibacterium marinum TaxID=2419782 RepID=A0A3B0C9V9_9FLAO|nr:transposase [Ulvibacterium marinum]
MQNGFAKRFNRTYRQDILDVYILEDIGQVRILTGKWTRDYNKERPHEALGGITPERYEREFSSKQACLEEQQKSSKT